jgi:hypothetical protein
VAASMAAVFTVAAGTAAEEVGTVAAGMAAGGAAEVGRARLSSADWLRVRCSRRPTRTVTGTVMADTGGCTAPIYDAYGNYLGQQRVGC